MKRLSTCLTIAGCLTLLSCDSAVEPPMNGGIDLSIWTISDSPGTAAETNAAAVDQAEAALALDSGRVIVTGPTSKTVSATPGQSVTIDSLVAGTYTVRLEGWEGDEITFRGEKTGIEVVAGANSSEQILFAPCCLNLNAIGDMIQLNVNAGGGSVSFQSSDPGVVGVDAGLVTAVSNGVATITATSGTSSAEITVNVSQIVATMTVTPATATINLGATQQFTATPLDSNGNAVSGVNILWVSSNHNVATVDQSGLATGVGDGGAATITAVGRGEPGSAALTVEKRFMIFTTSGTFTPPVGVTAVRVLMIGGGGGGGGGHQGGGGSGFVVFADCPVSGPVIITVGVGGAGGATAPDNSNFAGVPGTASRFGVCDFAGGGGVVTAVNGPAGNGGSGGGSSGQLRNGAAGGSGGSDGTAATYQGGTGQGDYTGLFANFTHVVPMAGAGGAGGMQSHGGGGGAGGLVIGASPGAGDGADPNGNSGKGGIGFGAGGGGGGFDSPTNSSTRWGGGTGADGVVYIEW